MTTMRLTPEQERIIQHPMGNHARVMAVAGAGKTATMVQLVKRYLDCGVPGKSIQVLMFNVLARKEFQDRMNGLDLLAHQKPQINTFHSFAYRIMRDIEQGGFDVRAIENWSEDNAERTDYFLRKIITDLEKKQIIPPNTIDVETARMAISLWKTEMVPPDRARAQSTGHAGLVDIYIQFEQQRIERNAYTMDDLIPRAVNALMNSPSLRDKWASHFRLVVVDEYQDVNYAQQQLLEFLIGPSTDVVVVGDDDQTIYEWRGARPEFMLHTMSGTLKGRPIIDYTLSRSFRFGPELAQVAHNVISLNTHRFVKPLIAFHHAQDTQVHIVRESVTSKNSLNDQLFQQLRQVLQITNDASKVIILGRTYNQLMNLEAICLLRGIPYTISGSQPFYKRSELITLVDYLRLAMMVHQPLRTESCRIFEKIINRPNRFINLEGFTQLLRDAMLQTMTPAQMLAFVTSPENNTFNVRQKEKLENLRMALAHAHQKITEGCNAHVVLQLIVDTTKYLEHFMNFYGDGEESKLRLDSISALISLAERQQMAVREFIKFFEQLDCMQGHDADAHTYVLVFTTIFRTKGLEFDYVFVPEVMHGSMPVMSAPDLLVWDAARSSAPRVSTSQLENERRLFYVALTRAKKAVYLGINQAGKQGVSQFIDEMHLPATKAIMQNVRESQGTVQSTLRDVLRKVGASSHLRAQLYEYYASQTEQLNDILADAAIGTWPAVHAPVSMTDYKKTAKPLVSPKRWWDEE